MQRANPLMTLFAGAAYEPLVYSGEITVAGDPSLYAALVDLIEPLARNFPIVTP